jgi:transposase
MAKTHNEDLRRALLDLVASNSTTIREAATRVGVSYSSAARWVHKSRTKALVPSRAGFAQLVREPVAESSIVVRIGRAEIAVRRGVDVELLQLVIQAVSGGASS